MLGVLGVRKLSVISIESIVNKTCYHLVKRWLPLVIWSTMNEPGDPPFGGFSRESALSDPRGSVLRSKTMRSAIVRCFGLQFLLPIVIAMFVCCGNRGLFAQEAPAADNDHGVVEEKATPLGQFLTLPSTIDDVVLAKVNRTGLTLKSQALQELRPAVLVLEITPGSSPFHQVRGLAKFLANDLAGVRTVAWIPKSVTGNHAVLALACKDIVIAPEAELGDISLGQALDPDEQAFIVNLGNRRHNRGINEALVIGLLDRQRELLWVQIEKEGAKPGDRESRVVLRQGLEDLQKSGIVIPEVRTIKEAGSPGVFSGERCRTFRILATHVLESRTKIAETYRLGSNALRENALTGEAPRGIVIKIDGPIEPQLEQFVMRQIDRAIGNGHNVIVFEIDSPGGMLGPSMDLASTISELKRRKIHAVAWIPRAAYSGAAIIALGCDEIYLAPDAAFGDAEPIELKSGGNFEQVPEKLVSFLVERLEHLAQLKGRPKALVGAMADKQLRVFQVSNKQDGRIWYMSPAEIHNANGEWEQKGPVPECEGDRLLTVSGQRAHELRLAEPPVSSLAELKTRLGIPPEDQLTVSEQTWVDGLVVFLNNIVISGFLLLLGLAAFYFEAHYPVGIFGICGALLFGIFFWSHFLGGTAGWLEVMLFVLGAGCLAMEIFVTPGFGVFGISGIVLCIVSFVLAMQTTIIPRTTSDLQGFTNAVLTVAGSIAGVIVLGVSVSRYLPNIPYFNQMVLTPPGFDPEALGPRLRPDLQTDAPNPLLQRDDSLVGRTGQSMTMLRPAGRAQIGDDYVDVVSEGAFIPAGKKVTVVEVSGMRVVVREVVG